MEQVMPCIIINMMDVGPKASMVLGSGPLSTKTTKESRFEKVKRIYDVKSGSWSEEQGFWEKGKPQVLVQWKNNTPTNAFPLTLMARYFTLLHGKSLPIINLCVHMCLFIFSLRTLSVSVRRISYLFFKLNIKINKYVFVLFSSLKYFYISSLNSF